MEVKNNTPIIETSINSNVDFENSNDNMPAEDMNMYKYNKSSKIAFKQILREEEMPREKLLKYGKSQLTQVELLALLLKTGTKEKHVLELSREILDTFTPQELVNIDVETISQIKGISNAKASEIVAVFELSKRLQESINYKETFASSEEIYEYAKHSMQTKTHEEMRVLYLNVKNKLIKDEVVATGSIHFVHIDIRKIVKRALDLQASSIIVMHNHPSGDVEPSSADIEITTQLLNACELLQIKLLDHLIISNFDYKSFYDSQIPPFT